MSDGTVKISLVETVAQKGKCNVYYLDGGFGLVKKSSAQVEDSTSSGTYIKPTVSRNIAFNFYQGNPHHFRAINLIALCVCGIGYNIEEFEKSGNDITKDSEYKKLSEFLLKPNQNNRQDVDDEDTFDNIVTNWYNDRRNYGDGYLEVVLNKGSELAEIYNLRAHNTFATRSASKLYYVQDNQNKKVYFVPCFKEKEDGKNFVLALKNYNPKSKFYGFPEWYPAIPDLMNDRAIVEYRIRKFDNNLMIQFAIVVEGGDIDSEGLEKINAFLRDNYKGLNNAGKALYINSDRPDVKIRIEKIEEEGKESSYIKSREQNRDFILAAHGVPPALLGVTTEGQLGNTTQIANLFKVFNETVVRPEKRTVENKLNKLFSELLGIKKFKIVFKDLTIETFKEIADFAIKAHEAGLLDKNEARSEIQWEPVDEEDTIEEQLAKMANQIKVIKKRIENEPVA